MYIPFGDMQALNQERLQRFQESADRRRLIAESRQQSHRPIAFPRWGRSGETVANERAA
jgi:hypothetical protein